MADNVDPDPPPPPAQDDVPAEVAVTTPVPPGPLPPDAPPPRQGCMAKRSCLEKCLIVIVIIIIIIVLAFLAAFIVFYFFYSPPEGTCLSEQCLASASRITEYMDDTADPCMNFYEYACGGWTKQQVLAPDESKIDLVTTISDANNVKIRRLLEEDFQATDDVYLQKPKKFYKACMNTQLIEDRGTKPFIELVDSVGEFPALNPSQNDTDFDFNLEEMLVKLAKLAVMPLFTVTVRRDLRDSAKNRITVGDAALALGAKTMYLQGRDQPIMAQYEKFLVENLVLLGAEQQQAQEDVKQVIDLEIEIARLMREPQLKADESTKYNPMKIPVVKARYPWLDWLKFFQGLALDTQEGTGISIDNEEFIIIEEPDYLKELGNLLEDTPKRVLANYLMSNLLKFTSALGGEFTKVSEKFVEVTQNTQPTPRWEQCVATTINIFPDFVGRMYVDNFFSPEAKKDVVNLIGNLTEVFKGMLQSNPWMTAKTKQNALAKLSNMQYKVGYPDEIKDDDILNAKYKTIPASEFRYFETLTDFYRYHINENINTLREKQDKSKWNAHAASVNAYYDKLANEIIFPAAFLQPPVYSPDYSDSMKYGGLGSYLGRFMVQGFDKQTGSQYDANGELKSWWSDEDKKNFDTRAQCFVDQYGCYKWDSNSIDGLLTLNENIADNGGLKTSYKAYENLIERRGLEEQRLPGLSLNHRQIFFISFAQVWCSKMRPELMKLFVQMDPHAPPEYRVLGTLQNSKAFAEAFECSTESRMNPGRKCVLW